MVRILVYVFLFLGFALERSAERPFLDHWATPFKPLGDLFFGPLPGLRLPLWDVLLVGLLAVAYLDGRAMKKRSRPLDLAIISCLATTFALCLWGLARGGSAYQMYFQLDAFLLMPLTALLCLAVLRTERAYFAVGVTFLLAALARAMMGAYFYYVVVRRLGLEEAPSFVTTHDDSVLFVGAVVVLLSYAVAKRNVLATLCAVCGIPVLLLLVTINQRRLAWVALLGSLVIMFAMLPRGRLRRNIVVCAFCLAPLLAIYVAIGRNRSGALFAPVRSFTTMFGDTSDDSTKSRDIENAGLVYTLRTSPLLGTGWGHEYIEVSQAYAGRLREIFPQYRYIPHNSVLGVVAFTGLIGLAGTWLIFPVGFYLAARAYRYARTSVARSATMSAGALMWIYLVQGYGDMGLQSVTSSLALALALAAAGRMATLTGAWPVGVARKRVRALPAGLIPARATLTRSNGGL